MTYLQYKQISLGEGKSVDLEHDVMRANEERSIAIRSFLSACFRRIRGFVQQVSARRALGGQGQSGSSGMTA